MQISKHRLFSRCFRSDRRLHEPMVGNSTSFLCDACLAYTVVYPPSLRRCSITKTTNKINIVTLPPRKKPHFHAIGHVKFARNIAKFEVYYLLHIMACQILSTYKYTAYRYGLRKLPISLRKNLFPRTLKLFGVLV